MATRVKAVNSIIIPTLSSGVIEAKKFPDNLKYIKGKLGVSQREMAKAIGVSPMLVSFWESGKREPSNANFMIIYLWAKQLRERSEFSFRGA